MGQRGRRHPARNERCVFGALEQGILAPERQLVRIVSVAGVLHLAIRADGIDEGGGLVDRLDHRIALLPRLRNAVHRKGGAAETGLLHASDGNRQRPVGPARREDQPAERQRLEGVGGALDGPSQRFGESLGISGAQPLYRLEGDRDIGTGRAQHPGRAVADRKGGDRQPMALEHVIDRLQMELGYSGEQDIGVLPVIDPQAGAWRRPRRRS